MFLLNKNTCVRLQQEQTHVLLLHKNKCVIVEQEHVCSYSTRTNLFLLNKNTSARVEQEQSFLFEQEHMTCTGSRGRGGMELPVQVGFHLQERGGGGWLPHASELAEIK